MCSKVTGKGANPALFLLLERLARALIRIG